MDAKTDAEIRATMTDEQILLERKLACEAIDGAIALGYQNTNKPPSDDHWLAPFWRLGRKQAELEASAALPSDAAQAPTVPAGYAIVPDYRGYAHLGTGQYVLNTSGEKPAELIISIATEAEKAGRSIGELRVNPEGHVLQPEDICVRLRFENVAGLDALEQQLRILREEHFAAPVAPAAAAPKMVAACCGRSECGGECGNEWRGMVPAQPDERAAFEARWNVFLASGEHESDAYLMGWKVWQAARATATKATLTADVRGAIVAAIVSLSIRADELKESNTSLDGTWCDDEEKAQYDAEVALISRLRALLAKGNTIPIYQIGAPGIAGHQVVWWDVPQEEYERQKAAGFMRTGIVYREAT